MEDKKNDKNKDQDTKVTFLAILTIVFAAILTFSGVNSFLSILISFLVFGVIACINELVERSEAQKQKKIKDIEETSKSYYKECKKKGVEYPISKYSGDIIRKIVDSKLEPSEADKYNIGYHAVAKEQRSEEKELAAEIQEKIKLHKTEKYFSGLRNTFVNHYEYYNRATNLSKDLLEKKTKTRAKTHDWAIAGGIAEGIGGLGIGVATALDVQEQNRLAEQAALETRERAYESISSISCKNNEVSEKAERVKSAFEKRDKNFDVRSATIESDFFKIGKVFVRESGTLSVSVSAKSNGGERKNTIDGVVYITVKNNDNVVGEGYIITPGYLKKFDKEEDFKLIESIGLGKIKSKEIICFPIAGYSFNKSEKYTYEFKALDVWEIDLTKLKKSYANLFYYFDQYLFESKSAIREAVVAALIT